MMAKIDTDALIIAGYSRIITRKLKLLDLEFFIIERIKKNVERITSAEELESRQHSFNKRLILQFL